jgi:hypothetical protein
VIRSPATLTAPVTSTWALIAFQSSNATPPSKLVIRLICASSPMLRKNPVPSRSEITTRLISRA